MADKSRFVIASLASAILLGLCSASGQRQNEPPGNVAGIPVNYDESLVGGYNLPNPLVLADGKPGATRRPGTGSGAPNCYASSK